MPDVQRKNNLTISNWQPPTEPIDNWQPPTAPLEGPIQQQNTAPDEEPSTARKLFEFANKPLLDITSPAMRANLEKMGQPTLADSEDVNFSRLKGFTSGATQGALDFVSSLTSPLSLGLEGLGGAAIGASKLGAPAIASALNLPGKLATAGMAVHGLYNMATAPDWMGRLQALPEAAMGVGGFKHLLEGRPPIKPSGSLTDIHVPESTPVNLPPEFTAVGAEPVAEPPKFKPTDQVQYDIARKKLQMGMQPGELGNPSENPRIEISKGESQVKKPLIKDYWITDKEGNKKLNPKYQKFAESFKQPVEEPQFASSGKSGVKIGADVRSLGKVLGSSLYKGDISKIATKELLQNSLDAVRHLGEHGEVHVTFGRSPKKFIEVADNGKGLSLKEIQTVFSDLGSSGKREDANAVGGFGLAKAAPLLGGESVHVTSIHNTKEGLFKYEFSGTPDDLLNGVDIKTEKLQSGKTGTTVRTYIPDKSSFYEAHELVKNIAANSPSIKGTIHVADDFLGEKLKNEDFIKHEPINYKDANKTTVSGPHADVDIIIPKNAKYAPRQGVRYNVANNGMFQTRGQYGYQEMPGIPDKVTINIRSKVPEGDPNYPFTANREELRGTTHDLVDRYIKENIVAPAQGKRVEQLKKVYEGLPKVELPTKAGSRPFFVYDVKNKFSPEELKYITEHPQVIDIATHISDTIHEAMEATKNQSWANRLEKVGLIFDEGLRGIHIPNPGSGHSAILINPFQIMEGRTPDEAAAGIVHVILHEIAHVEGGGHDEAFTSRLADIYEQYSARKAVDAQDKFLGVLEGEQNKYKPEIAEVLQRYSEARRREGATEDDLRGTGIGSEDTRSKGKNKVFDDSESSREPRPEAIDKLLEGLRNAGAKRATQEDLYSVERAKRIQNANRVNTGGLTGFYKQLHELKGELPKVDYERTKLKTSDVNDLINEVDKSNHLLDYEKIRAKMGLLKMLSAKREELPQFGELKLLSQVFGKKFDQVIEMHGGLGGNVKWQAVKDVAGMQKALMASIDMSAPLRQGSGLVYRPEWRKNIIPMVKMFGDKEFFDASMEALKDRPKYLLGKEAGLKLTSLGDEEAYPTGLAEKVPGVAASERAYVGFLNKLRADTFDSLIEEAKSAGLHPKDVMHEVANFVNVATGRGQLPGKLDRVATDLNTVFFSPRLIASRIEMMNPATYVKASPFIRKEFVKSAIGTASMGLITSGLMSMMGAKTATKLSDSKGSPILPIPGVKGMPGMPIDADFGKSRFGNTRIENYGGYLPYITYFGRMLSGERESSTTGKTSILGKQFAAPTRATITEDFVANKLSPAASLVWKILKQKDPTGKPYDFSPTVMKSLQAVSRGDFTEAMKNAKSGEVADTFIPMFIGDLISVMKDDPKHAPLLVGSFFGAGTQTYGKTPQKPRSTGMNIGIRP